MPTEPFHCSQNSPLDLNLKTAGNRGLALRGIPNDKGGLLQRNVAEGKLSDVQIQSELQQGNLAAVIQRLGPEAASLPDQIKTTLQSNYTEVELNGMLQGFLGSTPPSIISPTQ